MTISSAVWVLLGFGAIFNIVLIGIAIAIKKSTIYEDKLEPLVSDQDRLKT